MQVDYRKIFSLHILMDIICIFHANCQKACMCEIFALIMRVAFHTEEENTFAAGFCLFFS